MKNLSTTFKVMAASGCAMFLLAGCNLPSTPDLPVDSLAGLSTSQSISSVASTSTAATVSSIAQSNSTSAAATVSSAANTTATNTQGLSSLIQVQGLYDVDKAIQTAKNEAPGILVSFDYDDERIQAVYSIETMDDAGYTTEVEISVLDGSVVRKEKDNDRDNDANLIKTATITPENAVSIALGQVQGGRFKALDLDGNHNNVVYDVEVVDGSGIEKEVVVNALTGEVIAVRNEDYVVSSNASITVQQAEEAARNQVGGGTVLYTIFSIDDAQYLYEVKLVGTDGRLYDIEVSAQTGKIVSLERD